jgi:hypothetical protein
MESMEFLLCIVPSLGPERDRRGHGMGYMFHAIRVCARGERKEGMTKSCLPYTKRGTKEWTQITRS